ncbi:peptidyl-glycine alpha-amidating monooxygenase B-like [Clytia hemisphaerica]|uniref:peptidyl-glycine alpha-amidating monooxygenase B-like n=1 Tax=Clytia hemisphaerica TaxID=252671 RepID=UPI0034D7A42A
MAMFSNLVIFALCWFVVSADFVEDFVDNTMEDFDDSPDLKRHKIVMPGVSPQKPDTVLSYAMKMPDQDLYIIRFEPIGNMRVAHHMMIFSCEEPFLKDKIWDNGHGHPKVCKDGYRAEIKYAWGKNAPPLQMPKDVAFHIGGRSKAKYLVLEVHYLHVDSFKDGKTKDHSGFTFITTSKRPKYFAGIYLLQNMHTSIPPHQKKFHMSAECRYRNKEGMKMHAFRFRVHSHKIGTVISGYLLRDGKYTLIGKGDPQRPQAFNKVDNEVDIQDGDIVVAQCTYNSMERNRITKHGQTHKDEMCTFYVMMYYEAKYGDKNPACLKAKGPFTFPKDSDVTLAEMERRTKVSM